MATYNQADKEFADKYKKEIEGIARYNNVDMSVAKSMFQTNLKNDSGVYKGGGVAENWGEMKKDYENLVTNAKESIKGKTTINAYGQEIEQESLASGEVKKNSTSTSTVGEVVTNIIASGGNFESDTIGTIVGVAVLYMFLGMFRRS